MSDYPMLISNKLHSFRNFKVQVYIYIYSLHLTPKLKYLYSDICVIQKEAVSLNRSFRQTMNSQRTTNKRLF